MIQRDRPGPGPNDAATLERYLPSGRWVAVDGKTNDALVAELARELSPGHVLFGRPVRAIGRSALQDDVLFEALDDDRALFLVHLTWRQEPDPIWPSTTRFDTLGHFLRAESEDELDE